MADAAAVPAAGAGAGAPSAAAAAAATTSAATTKRSPSDFLRGVIGRPVTVRLVNGTDYKGACGCGRVLRVREAVGGCGRELQCSKRAPPKHR
jgi:hypothetical protein